MMRRMKLALIYTAGMAVCFLLNVNAADSISAAEPFEAFLTKHCVRCHGPERVERELRIDRLSRDFKIGTDGHLWAEVEARTHSG